MVTFVLIYLFLFPISLSFAVDWTTFDKGNTDLPSDNILCIAIDSNGNKWFGTDSGLVHFDGEKWNTFSNDSNSTLVDNYVNDVAIEFNGSESLLWIATENGISTVDISNAEHPFFIESFRTDNSELISDQVKTLTIDPGNVRWFGAFSGVSSFINDNWAEYSTQNFWIEHDKVVSLESGPYSMVYIGTDGGGVSRLKKSPVDAISSASPLNTIWTGFYEPDSGKLKSNNIYSILIEQNGYQWFGTDSGVALHTSYNTLSDWKNYTIADGLIDDFVQAIGKENDGSFWFGTRNGVSKFDGVSWTNYTTEDGLAGNNVRDITIDIDGSLWFATDAGISVFTNTTAIASSRTTKKFDLLRLRNFPNPFNMQTSIVFTLNENSFVELDIYNITGQHVVSLANELWTAGIHSIIWNGFNAAGKEVPSGVYFVQLAAGELINTHKILVTK